MERTDCQDRCWRSWRLGYNWRQCDCGSLRGNWLQRDSDFICYCRFRRPRRQTGHLAARAIARRSFGDLWVRLLPDVHHRAVLAAAVARHSGLRAAVGKRRQRCRKQQQRQAGSGEFAKSIHGSHGMQQGHNLL